MSIVWQGARPDFKKELDEFLEQELFNTAKDVFNGVVMRTPARSGELRASWNLSADQPNFVTVGDPNSSPRHVDAVLPPPSSPTFVKSRTGLYFVTNGKAYAGVVEEGGPHNVAHHMMERTLDSLDL